ncbi:MAG: hypothetical protein ACYS9X_31440, partial [Planctomycetota bacterium]
MVDTNAACTRCSTPLEGATRCPVCGLDVGARAGPSPSEALEGVLLDKELGGFLLEKVIGRSVRGVVFLGSPAEADEAA